MLRHMDLPQFADRIAKAVNNTLEEGKVRTRDIGGNNSTSEYVHEIIKKIR